MYGFDKMSGRLSGAEVVRLASELHDDEYGISSLCDIMLTSEDDRCAYNSAWILLHLHKTDKEIYLRPFYDRIADKAMSQNLKIRRGLVFSVILEMELPSPPRMDVYDFCVNGMFDMEESYSSRSVMIKMAARICKAIPELKSGFSRALEILSDEDKASISAAYRYAARLLKI